MLIEGFGLSSYRSFGPDVQLIGACQKINLFVGANNSGKSNILLFLTRHYANLVGAIKSGSARGHEVITGIEQHLGKPTDLVTFAIGHYLPGEDFDKWRQSLLPRFESQARSLRFLDKLYDSLSPGDSTAWFYFESPRSNSSFKLAKNFIQALAGSLNEQEWHALWAALHPNSSGGNIQHWIPEVLSTLSPVHRDIPKVTLIPAIRRIESTQGTQDDYSGLGLVERLARLQNPGLTEQNQKKRFEAINIFLRKVTDNQSATLEVPYERELILVHMDGKTLPLSSLGTGIHEVVILAAAATILENQVLCIEEPEIHLHPTLQRKLLTYLGDSTSNQYFIATHSAHLLDVPEIRIFGVRHKDGETIVNSVETPRERAEVCADLGYRPSDLLQANSIIWVEGPSDRIYLNHWIRAVAPDLLEGAHYSIMFYGGRLLCHLSANDPEVEEFISLRRLNRHISIIIDSDKRSRSGHINDTKRRVQAEFDKGPGFAWITAGREIENYLAQNLVEQAVMAICPGAHAFAERKDKFQNAVEYLDRRGRVRNDVDKIKLAHEITKYPADLAVLDLKARVGAIARFVQQANGLG